MWCLRARLIASGVGFCALMAGCAQQTANPPVAINNRPTQMVAVDTAATPQFAVDCIATPATQPVSEQDIIRWSTRGDTDDIIIDRLQRSPAIFHLGTGDEIHLRDAGVSDEVIRAMKATAG
jgi:hypothetical protein